MIGMEPWGRLEQLKGWRVEWADIAERGLTQFNLCQILLREGLKWRSERAVLSHEVVHAERGPFPKWMTAREEEAVSRESARRLLPIRRLGEAMSWSLNIDELAEELDVDRPTIEARLRSLHPAERAYLARRLEHHG